jgi:putative transcriptional regulator
MASIHETAEGLHAASAMDKRTMREFDELCLTPVRRLRTKGRQEPNKENQGG